MTRIIERIKALALPLDEVVVIGSGLLDALGLRTARDIDLVVSKRLFEELRVRGDYEVHRRRDELYLTKGDQEVWLDWGQAAPFEVLKARGQIIEGITFVDQEFLTEWKRRAARPKDVSDVRLLEGDEV